MAINIPSSVFDIYNEAVLFFARPATIIYPPKRADCPNCVQNTLGVRTGSISIYVPGGPIPFERGMPCPYCHGKGYKEIEETDTVTVRIYWDRKNWVNVGIPVDIPDMMIQTISFMTDFDKINKCKYLVPHYGNIDRYINQKFQRYGQSYPQGFKQNDTKYFVTFWKLAESS